MINIKLNTLTYDEFIVLDEQDNPITGLTNNDFTVKLYDPDGSQVANISGGITVNISEVGNGVYRVSFIPNKLGNWVLIVYNTNYFPFGKGQNYFCIENFNDDLYKLLIRILGLSQENYRLFNPKYDRHNNLIAGIIKIYNTANDCSTDTNPIAEYEIDANFDLRTNLMTHYKVTKKE